MQTYQFIQDFKNLFFPRTCFACGTPLTHSEDVVCLHCYHSLFHKGLEIICNQSVHQRFWGKMDIEKIYALMPYQKGNGAQALIGNFKYKHFTQIGKHIGKTLGKELTKINESFDAVVPIPLHKKKLNSRGFNQSELLGSPLAKELNIPLFSHSLIRNTNSKTQTRKSRIDRWQNVHQIFEVNHSYALKGKHILLVDDILTTGATLEAAAKQLLQSGVRKISIAVAAVAE